MPRKTAIYSIALLFALIAATIPIQSMAMPKTTGAADMKTVTGKIVETMNASGYTYLLVDTGAAKNWVAIPETAVKTGSQVSYYVGMEMTDFTSKTLNKTFPSITFSAGLAETATTVVDTSPAKTTAQDDSFTAALQAEQKGIAAAIPPTAQATGGSAVAIAPLQEITVAKAEGENAYTVAEIFAKYKELAGKKVRIQGKVVKFSPSIMGKNWVHLQDGTGNPLQNSHDLVLTTDTTLAVDAIVTMEGILAAEKDFGSGYKYLAIVEQALLVK